MIICFGYGAWIHHSLLSAKNKLVAGTPQMTATGIELFQGERHIVYSFDLKQRFITTEIKADRTSNYTAAN